MGTGFTKNAHRLDPYKNFKFHIVMDGRVVAGINKVSALKRSTEVVTYASGGDNSFETKSPGRSKYEAVTLSRGLTHDPDFMEWANKVHQYKGAAAMDLVGYKIDLTLEHLNEKGQVAFRYFLRNCWPSEYTAMPELDASANAIAIEDLKLELEGWERDLDTKEPDEAG